MIEKARAVVLHQIKYGDSGIVVQVYSRESGRHSLLIRGMRSKRSGKHNVLFQPLFILDLVYYKKESRSMQVLKEFSVAYSPLDIYADIKKSCIAVFLGEVLSSVLREESPHPGLYDFIEESVRFFDGCKAGLANFHIAFLIGLSSYLGFEPGYRDNISNRYFDMVNGIFVPFPPVHGNYADPVISGILADFFSTTYDHMGEIRLTGTLRDDVLETLLRYFSIHLPGLKKINSLGIMKEIFS